MTKSFSKHIHISIYGLEHESTKLFSSFVMLNADWSNKQYKEKEFDVSLLYLILSFSEMSKYTLIQIAFIPYKFIQELNLTLNLLQ